MQVKKNIENRKMKSVSSKTNDRGSDPFFKLKAKLNEEVKRRLSTVNEESKQLDTK